MTPLTLDLPPEMHARLSEEAERRNVSESAFVQEIVAKALVEAEESVVEQIEPVVAQAQAVAEPRNPGADQPRKSGRMSCLDLAGDLIGSVKGPPDLSTTGVRCLDLAGDLIGSVRSGKPDLATNPRYLEEAIVRDASRWRGETDQSEAHPGETNTGVSRVAEERRIEP